MTTTNHGSQRSPSFVHTFPGGEISGDHLDLRCQDCGVSTAMYFALSDGRGGFTLDCRNCSARLVAYRVSP